MRPSALFKKNSHGISTLFGLERLRVLLTGAYPHIVARHPQIFGPPFFPVAGGVSLAFSRDYLIVDFADTDEPLATWLARRLTIEGYSVWCRSIAPVGGSSLNDTIGVLVKQRAFRFLPILSPVAVSDPDLSARRAAAATISHDMLLPIVAAPFEKERLDTKTRALEPVHFENSWATGLKQLLDLLAVAHCPQASSGGAGIALRSFMPPDVTSNQPEMLYANRFRVLQVPDAILRFTSMKPLEGDRFYQVQRQWAFRRVNPKSFLAFHPPPNAIQAELDIQNAGGAAWVHFVEIDGILTRNLVPELVTKVTGGGVCQTRTPVLRGQTRLILFRGTPPVEPTLFQQTRWEEAVCQRRRTPDLPAVPSTYSISVPARACILC